MKKFLASILTLTLLAGCSSSTASTTTSTKASSSMSVAIATDTDISSMNSSVATDGTSLQALVLCMAGLVQLDSDGVAQPDLAKSWEVSDDSLTYTFHIQEDAKWSNGTDLTANDFVYAWNRLIDPDTASDYSFLIDTNADVNTVNAESWEATDDDTFVVHLSSPCEYFLTLMAFPSLYPLNEEYVEEQGDQYALSVDNMIYCGPYLMNTWTVGDSYTFVKNDQYWDADSYKDNVEEIDFRLIQGQSAILDYEAGNLDYVKLTSEVIDDYADRDDLVNYLSGFSWYLSLNFGNDYLSNLNVRKAIAYAIDTETMCDTVLKDGSVALDGIVTKATAINSDGEDYRDIAGKVTLGYDLDQAKEYYEEGCKELGVDSISLEFLYEDADVSKNVAAYVMAALEKVGFTITGNCEPKKSRMEDMNNHNYEIGLTRWGPDYADPQTYMDLFYTKSNYNAGQYQSDEYDDLITAAEVSDAADSEKRWEDFAEAEKVLISEDVAVVPLYQAGNTALQDPNLSGIVYHAAGVTSYRHLVLSE